MPASRPISWQAVDQMADVAKRAAVHAYCPYSRFPVGAAVLCGEDGLVVAGCNVENAAYGPSLCAERNAIGHMVALGRRDLRAVLVYTPTSHPTAPCGTCLQVIREFASDAQIVCLCDSEARIDACLSELLPQAFGPKNLGRSR
ncbi:cytidine deaminase [Myxococcota bacterium]